MKAKSFVACVFTAVAVPLAPALAQNADPAGPQGTGWYGARNAALPVPQPVLPYTYEPQDAAASEPLVVTNADARTFERRRWTYRGNSFETNPPVPAP